MSLKVKWWAQFVCWKRYVSANCYQQLLCFWQWFFSLYPLSLRLSNTHIPTESTESEWLRLERTSGDHLVHAHCQEGLPRAGCPGPCPDGFWLPPIYNHLSGQPVPSAQSPSQQISCFLTFRGNLWSFSLCPLPLVLSLGTVEESLTPSSSHLPIRCLYRFMSSPTHLHLIKNLQKEGHPVFCGQFYTLPNHEYFWMTFYFSILGLPCLAKQLFI